ncbi:hypothetical protein [Pseudomonas sp. KU43P]|uniref:hypothetical protein n=1 Tax=Pseudomonas sp. KU43P TaxID=2487887 RepID=UPI002954C6FD|nr:hypothetical protein [Pseudomonas sp. KU43P]
MDALIAQAQNHLIHTTDFVAAWLLDGAIGSTRWKTANGNKHFKTKNGWQDTVDVNFKIKLADGSFLTDPENAILLTGLQKWAFHLRNGLYGTNPGPRTWEESITPILNIAAWMYLQKDRLLPHQHGFNLLDKDSIKGLVNEVAQGGWEHALCVIPRLLDHLHTKAFGETAPQLFHDNPFNLPDPIKIAILDSLALDSTYRKVKEAVGGRTRERISVSYARHVLGRPGVSGKNSKLVVFLAQFNNTPRTTPLVKDYYRASERPKHHAPLAEVVKVQAASEGTLRLLSQKINLLCRGYVHEETTIPRIDLDAKQLKAMIADKVAVSTHKQMIPLKFGLKILRRSTELVIVHGKSIINCALEYISLLESDKDIIDIHSRRARAERHLPRILSKHKSSDLEGAPGKPLAEALNIECGYNQIISNDFRRLGLNQALAILIGATCNIISILKPLRIDELVKLKRNCLLDDTLLGGSWLESSVGKTGSEGINMELARPIPRLVLKGIRQLQHLGSNLAVIYGDSSEYAQGALFYFPSLAKLQKSAAISIEPRIRRCMELFTDYIEAPVDEYGRRFYPSPHEFRKFFILLMYWHEQNLGFNVASWMAGHTMVQHTQAYTDASINADEISLWEAECIEDKIIELEVARSERHDLNGLIALYEAVKERFGVGQIRGLPRSEYLEFLQDLRAEGIIKVKPYLIFAPGTSEPDGIDLAFKFEDKQDEQF